MLNEEAYRHLSQFLQLVLTCLESQGPNRKTRDSESWGNRIIKQ